MTAADRLRNLADKATPGPWRDQGWDDEEYARFILGGGAAFSSSEHMVGAIVPQPTEGDSPTVQADARLIALAPDLLRWAADAADLLSMLRRYRSDSERERLIAPLLARLDTIAGNDQT